jgi:hypothetical protein
MREEILCRNKADNQLFNTCKAEPIKSMLRLLLFYTQGLEKGTINGSVELLGRSFQAQRDRVPVVPDHFISTCSPVRTSSSRPSSVRLACDLFT